MVVILLDKISQNVIDIKQDSHEIINKKST